MKKASKVLALLLALAMLLTACGGGSGTSSEEKKESSGAASSTEESKAEESKTEGEASGAEESSAAAIENKMTDADTLVVGAPELNGDYINGFSNSTYDVWIKRLIGNYGGDLGYSTYYADENGEFKLNKTVVNGEPTRTESEDGTVTYTFKINDNLVWNDGEKITAKDFLFGTLFAASVPWTNLGTTNSQAGLELVGFNDYHTGASKAFKGLRLLGDDSFSLTIDKEYVPYFYETALIASSPTPLHRYAPKLDVVDSEEGAMLAVKEGTQITDEDKAALVSGQEKVAADAQKAVDDFKAQVEAEKKDDGSAAYDMKEFDALLPKLEALTPEEYAAAKKEGKLADGTSLGDGTWTQLYDLMLEAKAEAAKAKEYKENPDKMDPTELLLTEACLDVSQTYRFKPDVTCGPYNFVSFGNNMAKVTLNDKFLGDANGKKPTIKNVIVQTINTELEVDFAISGDIDIAYGVIEGAKIDKAKANPDKVGYVHYARNGYGFMPIINDMNATKYKGVRQAIAYCLDREQFVQTICGGYGAVVQGCYGLSMWEYKHFEDEINDTFINYTLNPDAANKALDADSPYKFEKDGKTPFDPAKAKAAYDADKENFDYWRYDENGKQLVVYHEGSIEAAEVSGLISTQIPDNAKLCGMKYVFNSTDFATMLKHYYNPDETSETAPSVFNMGNGFAVPNDPFYSFHSSQIGADNRLRVNDPELDKVLVTMRKCAPTDRQTWLDGWIKVQRWYNENMPGVPLYGNDYHDIFNIRVKGLETTPMWDWSNDICDVSLAQ